MSDANPDGPTTDPAAEREWWDDPSLPWKRKPSRAEITCFTAIGIVAVYSLAMLPLRPALLAAAPHVLAALGSWTGTILVGALAGTNGDPWWPLVWVLGTIGLIKFDWIYWWAGRLWGRGLIEIWSGRSERARRLNQRVERFTRKYETWAIAVTFLPIPLPRGVVFAVLGEAGTSLPKFLTVSVISSFISTGAYLWIGYTIREPAVAAMDTYGRYLWYLSIAILVAMLANYWWKQSRGAKAGS